MLVRPRRAAAFVVGTALVAFATACTNPTAPAATRHVPGMSGDGVNLGGSSHTSTPAPTQADGVNLGGSS